MNSVRDYGAIGDGITDDTDALQRAVDTGHPVVLAEGPYLIKRAIQFPIERTA